jgi:hypothetical protein
MSIYCGKSNNVSHSKEHGSAYNLFAIQLVTLLSSTKDI